MTIVLVDLLVTCFSSGLRLEAAGTSQADDDDCSHDTYHNSDGSKQSYSTGYLLYLRKVVVQETTCKVAKGAVDGCPEDTTGRIIDDEVSPAHLVDTGQKCSPGSQHCNEAPKEDGFIAVLVEELFRTVEVLLPQEQVFTETLDKSPASRTTDVVADVVSSNCTQSSTDDNERDE